MECYEEVQRQLTVNRMGKAAKTGLAAVTALCLVLCGTEAISGGIDVGFGEMGDNDAEMSVVSSHMTEIGGGILSVSQSKELKALLALAGGASVIPAAPPVVSGEENASGLREADTADVPGMKSATTDIPIITVVPNKTDTPVITDVSNRTDTPIITDVPNGTDTPVITDVPKGTDIPVITDVPNTTDTPIIMVVPDTTDTPIITEVPNKNGEIVPSYAVVDGFFVDEAGMIRGIANPETAVSDGYMELPSTGCTGIARDAFLEAPKGIVEVYIPANIVNVEEGAFLGLDDAEWFEADPENEALSCDEGVLFTDGGECLLAFPAGRTGAYRVPESTVRFAQDAFTGSRLEKIDMRAGKVSDTGNFPESILFL